MQAKVAKGDPLIIEAATFNTMIDVATWYQGRNGPPSARTSVTPPMPWIVRVRNNTSAAIDRFGVLCLDGMEITPDESAADNIRNIDAWAKTVLFTGASPSESNASRLVVLQQAIDAAGIGRAQVLGVTPAFVDVQNEAHAFAEPEAGETAQLVSAETGTIRILWVEPGTGTKIAAVLLGGASAATATSQKAKIVSHAGSAPPFIYTANLVTHDGSSSFAPANFTTGALLSASLINIAESGPDGTAIGPLEAGTIVEVTRMGAYWACECYANCGTY